MVEEPVIAATFLLAIERGHLCAQFGKSSDSVVEAHIVRPAALQPGCCWNPGKRIRMPLESCRGTLCRSFRLGTYGITEIFYLAVARVRRARVSCNMFCVYLCWKYSVLELLPQHMLGRLPICARESNAFLMSTILSQPGHYDIRSSRVALGQIRHKLRRTRTLRVGRACTPGCVC